MRTNKQQGWWDMAVVIAVVAGIATSLEIMKVMPISGAVVAVCIVVIVKALGDV